MIESLLFLGGVVLLICVLVALAASDTPPKTVPEYRGWDHDAAFRALWSRYGGRRPRHGAYAFLYRQRPNSAVLYEADAPVGKVRRLPLHLHPESRSADTALLDELLPYICVGYTELSEKKSTTPVQWCAVTDWNGFASVVGLPPTPPRQPDSK